MNLDNINTINFHGNFQIFGAAQMWTSPHKEVTKYRIVCPVNKDEEIKSIKTLLSSIFDPAVNVSMKF